MLVGTAHFKHGLIQQLRIKLHAVPSPFHHMIEHLALAAGIEYRKAVLSFYGGNLPGSLHALNEQFDDFIIDPVKFCPQFLQFHRYISP